MNVLVKIQCLSCETIHTIQVGLKELMKYERGAKVQDAFPNMNLEIREMFISRFCPTCSNRIMKGK